MTEKELRTWMRRESLTDAWHVSTDEGVPEPKAASLDDIHARFGNSAQATLAILHESQLKKSSPAWVDLDLTSFSEKTAPAARRHSQPARSSRRSSGRKRGLMLQFALLVLLCVIGVGVWAIVSVAREDKISRPLTEEEEISGILASLGRNLARNAATQDNQADNTPVIRTVISATQHMLMVKNSNLEDWQSFKLSIILPGGETFVCNFTQEIPAYSTLSISMRRITTQDGKPLTRDMITSGTQLELEVPNYPKWSSSL